MSSVSVRQVNDIDYMLHSIGVRHDTCLQLNKHCVLICVQFYFHGCQTSSPIYFQYHIRQANTKLMVALVHCFMHLSPAETMLLLISSCNRLSSQRESNKTGCFISPGKYFYPCRRQERILRANKMLSRHRSLFMKAFKVASLSNTLRIACNTTEGKFRMNCNRRYCCILKARCYIYAVGTLLVSLQTARAIFYEQVVQFDIATIFIAAFSCVIQIMNMLHLHSCYDQAQEWVLYINSNFDFIEKYKRFGSINRKLSGIERLSIMIGYMVLVSGMVMPPVIVYGLHFKNPCKPSLAGYWLLEQCASDYYRIRNNAVEMNLSMAKKVLLLIVNHWLWNFGFRLGTFIISGFHVLLVQNLRDCLDAYWNFYNDANNWGGYKQGFKVGVMYRQVQLLAGLTNILQQKCFLVILMVGPILVISFCISALVKIPLDSEHVWSLLIFFMLCTDSILMLMVCLGGMASVHLKSVDVLKQIGSRMHIKFETKHGHHFSQECKWRQKFHMSCSVIKIKFGSDSFIEALTPLNCMDCSTNLTVNLLLLGNE